MAFDNPAQVGPADIAVLQAQIAAADTKATDAGTAAASADGKAVAAQTTATTAVTAAATADGKAVTADTKATNAGTAAATADGKAVAAQTTATDAATVAARKIRTFIGPDTAPPAAEGAGDLWIVSNQGNLFKRATAPGAGSWAAFAFGAASIDADFFTGRTITGGLFRTSDAGNRWEMSAALRNIIRGFGDFSFDPAEISTWDTSSAGDSWVEIHSGRVANTLHMARLRMGSGAVGSPPWAMFDAYKPNGGATLVPEFSMRADVDMPNGTLLQNNNPNIVGTKVKSRRFGAFNGTLGALSRATITHNLGVIPDYIGISSRRLGWWQWAIESRSDTQFTVELRDQTGALQNGTTGAFDWEVVSY